MKKQKEIEIISTKAEIVNEEISQESYKTNSVFMGINIAGLRCKQLSRGAHSRLAADTLKHKNTIIAVQEVKQGLVAFKYIEDPLV
jgi:DNA-directed RNA polymerase subunit K/omega